MMTEAQINAFGLSTTSPDSGDRGAAALSQRRRAAQEDQWFGWVCPKKQHTKNPVPALCGPRYVLEALEFREWIVMIIHTQIKHGLLLSTVDQKRCRLPPARVAAGFLPFFFFF